MMFDIKSIILSLKGEQDESIEGSVAITDSKVIEEFISNPNNTFLVSFPRTGSHWLRMIMELYFGCPSLVRIFYYPQSTNFLTLHTHDKELDLERENVIYLYRDPVDTVYSQLNFYSEDINDIDRITYWADQYGQHLDKWLCKERFTKKKTVLTYEGMKGNMAAEFAKITDHFGQKLDLKKLEKAASQITRDEVRKKTKHDPRVINRDSDYAARRKIFVSNYKQVIWSLILSERSMLKNYFATYSYYGLQ